MRKQFTLKHLAVLVTLVCLALGAFRGWYTAERNAWFEANTGLYRFERKVLGFKVKSVVERSQLHLELLAFINEHDLEYDETWLPMSSFSRQRGGTLHFHKESEWLQLLTKIYSRSRGDADRQHGEEEIRVELLKIYLPAEKTKENIEPTRQLLLDRLNELISPRYATKF